MEYPSIYNLYAMDKETHERGPEQGFQASGVDQIARWLVTEKIDGMNIRVQFNPYGWNDEPGDPGLSFYGRTDRAQLPGDLLDHLQGRFTTSNLMATFDYDPGWQLGDDERYAWEHTVTLFGEGYGPGIQGAVGAAYGEANLDGGKHKQFRLFDVNVSGAWLSWENVEDVARKLGVHTAPVLAYGVSLEEAKSYVSTSDLIPASPHIEGIVARTDPYLFDGRGNRVMFKYKTRDLA